MAGASLLMPGAQLDAASLLELMNAERATSALGVPTVWLNLLNHLRDKGGKIETLKRILIGGAAMPRALMEAYGAMGIRLQQGWGMTESSPLVTVNKPKPACLRLEGEAADGAQMRAGPGAVRRRCARRR